MDGRVEGSRERESWGLGAGNITVGTGKPVFLISAGLCHSGRVGPPLSGPQLQRKGTHPTSEVTLSQPGPPGRKERVWRGKMMVLMSWNYWTRTEVYSEDTNRNQDKEPLEIWSNGSSGLERGDVSVLGSWKSVASCHQKARGKVGGPDGTRSIPLRGPRCQRQCFLQ